MTALTDIIGMDTQPWMHDPARNCASPSDAPRDIQLHADLWFPAETREKYAVKLCDGCPVRRDCLRWAVPQTDLVGILGGTTAGQRATLRKKMRKVAA